MHPNTSRKASQIRVIENSQIEQILAMRETQNGLKERLRLIEEAIAKMEGEVIASIDRGATLSIGVYAVRVQETERRYPAWKEHFIECMGKAEADAVLCATVPTVHRKLVIE